MKPSYIGNSYNGNIIAITTIVAILLLIKKPIREIIYERIKDPCDQ